MLETLWYLLVLLGQVVQVNPQAQPTRVQFEVYIGSKAAYEFVVQGTFVQGQFVDTATNKVFGEFESTRRVPQTFVIFPRQALPAELEQAASGNAGAAAATSVANPGAAGTAKEKDLVPFTIDYSKVLKMLASFRVKPKQSVPFTEKERFLSGSGDGSPASSASPRPSVTQAMPSANPSPTPSGSPSSASPSASPGSPDDSIEIHQFDSRIVLSAPFAQILIIAYLNQN